jgi:hypothetical protein
VQTFKTKKKNPVHLLGDAGKDLQDIKKLENRFVAVLIHTCKRELSPAHLVCPRRHNA